MCISRIWLFGGFEECRGGRRAAGGAGGYYWLLPLPRMLKYRCQFKFLYIFCPAPHALPAALSQLPQLGLKRLQHLIYFAWPLAPFRSYFLWPILAIPIITKDNDSRVFGQRAELQSKEHRGTCKWTSGLRKADYAVQVRHQWGYLSRLSLPVDRGNKLQGGTFQFLLPISSLFII